MQWVRFRSNKKNSDVISKANKPNELTQSDLGNATGKTNASYLGPAVIEIFYPGGYLWPLYPIGNDILATWASLHSLANYPS